MFSTPNPPPSHLTGSRLQQKEIFLAEAQENSPPAAKPGDACRERITAPRLSTSTNIYFDNRNWK